MHKGSHALLLVVAASLVACGGEEGGDPQAPQAQKDQVQAWIADLRSAAPRDSSTQAVRGLSSSGKVAVTPLIAVAEGTLDELQRMRAVGTLGNLGADAESALPVLDRLAAGQQAHLAGTAQGAAQMIRRALASSRASEPALKSWDEWWDQDRVR